MEKLEMFWYISNFWYMWNWFIVTKIIKEIQRIRNFLLSWKFSIKLSLFYELRSEVKNPLRITMHVWECTNHWLEEVKPMSVGLSMIPKWEFWCVLEVPSGAREKNLNGVSQLSLEPSNCKSALVLQSSVNRSHESRPWGNKAVGKNVNCFL